MKLFIYIAIITAVFFQAVAGQERYKIRTKDFQWQVYKSDRFDVYYYPEEQAVIPEVVQILEQTAIEYERRLEITLKNRIPVIIYATLKDFAQTNTTDSILDENIGGFSEMLKRRLVMPFNGDMYAFRSILRHELVHIFQYEFLYPEKSIIASLYSQMSTPPLWVIEGMAEYFSDNWQAEGLMSLRENVLSDTVIPIALEDDYVFSYYGYYSYKLSQSFVQFLVKRYGEHAFIQYFKSIGRRFNRDIKDEFRNIYPISLQIASDIWLEDLKKTYWIEAAEKPSPYDLFSVIGLKDEENASILMPVFSPNGDVVAAYSNLKDEGNILIINAITGELIDNVTAGNQDRAYDYVKIAPSNLQWHPNGEVLFAVVKETSNDAVIAFNVLTGEMTFYRFEGIDSILSIAVSDDGSKLAFSGIKGLYSNIFTYSFNDSTLTQTTNDPYLKKSVTVNGNSIVFLTTREYGDEIHQVGFEPFSSETVLYRSDSILSVSANNGLIYFERAFGHAFNICAIDPIVGTVWQFTEAFNSTLYPSVRNNTMIFSMIRKNRYILGKMTLDPEKKTVIVDNTLPSRFLPLKISSLDIQTLKDGSFTYKPVMRADYLTGSFQYDTSGYFRSYSTIMGTDMLGDYRFLLNFDISSINSLDDINVQFQFNYLKNRPIWGGSLYFWKNKFYSLTNWHNDYSEQLAGATASIIYPLSPKNAVEGAVTIYQKTVNYPYYDFTERNMSYGLYAAFNHDATKWWGYYHPIYGYKGQFIIEKTFGITSDSLIYTTLFSDLRHYTKISRRMSIAQRVVFGDSFGEDPQMFKIGGINTVRGYDDESLRGTKMFLYNLEIRFPLTDFLQFSLPFGLPPLRGVLFYDMAYTGNEGDPFVLIEDRSGRNKFSDFTHGSVGMGVRSYLGGFFFLKFDWAWKTDFSQIYTGSGDSMFHFGIAQDF